MSDVRDVFRERAKALERRVLPINVKSILSIVGSLWLFISDNAIIVVILIPGVVLYLVSFFVAKLRKARKLKLSDRPQKTCRWSTRRTKSEVLLNARYFQNCKS